MQLSVGIGKGMSERAAVECVARLEIVNVELISKAEVPVAHTPDMGDVTCIAPVNACSAADKPFVMWSHPRFVEAAVSL
jgi:hypothetical protein